MPTLHEYSPGVGHDKYVCFALELVKQATDSINYYVTGRRAVRGRHRNLEVRKCLARAVVSYMWLTGLQEGRDGLSVRLIADSVGIDPVTFTVQIFSRWTAQQLNRIKSIAIEYQQFIERQSRIPEDKRIALQGQGDPAERIERFITLIEAQDAPIPRRGMA